MLFTSLVADLNHGLPSPFWLILHIYLSLRNVFQDYFSDIEKANICKLSVFFISTKQMNRVHPLCLPSTPLLSLQISQRPWVLSNAPDKKKD
ncbi:uncharacterized protein LOC122009495 isoform X2 [Zingiber officinale]|uniref:uncharacterized protein LOC122009495 isoform X2 n=1 Tax=Zingiber officinale TaxID=94328 RepID=UPI001C4B1A9B|nr:uncharacterized protein LOC122009495 isoform X2 [Zingiber officinale]